MNLFSLHVDTLTKLPLAYNHELDKNSEHVLVTVQVNKSLCGHVKSILDRIFFRNAFQDGGILSRDSDDTKPDIV